MNKKNQFYFRSFQKLKMKRKKWIKKSSNILSCSKKSKKKDLMFLLLIKI